MYRTHKEIIDDWKSRDSFIGTGFACAHYADCAREAVKDGEMAPKAALMAYAHCTISMTRWNAFYRPTLSELESLQKGESA